MGHLLDEDNKADTIWGDSAYRSVLIEAVLALMGFESEIHERTYRNRPLPLTAVQIEDNREKSRIRTRVEHVFGSWIMGMGGKLVRMVGLAHAKVQLGVKEFDLQFDAIHLAGNVGGEIQRNRRISTPMVQFRSPFSIYCHRPSSYSYGRLSHLRF